MPLSRNNLIHMAIDQYFIACNKGDLATIMTTFAPDCIVRFSSAKFEYRGLDALKAHMEEFRDTFAIIDFHDFVPVVDTEAQTIAVQFEVKLVDHEDQAPSHAKLQLLSRSTRMVCSTALLSTTVRRWTKASKRAAVETTLMRSLCLPSLHRFVRSSRKLGQRKSGMETTVNLGIELVYHV